MADSCCGEGGCKDCPYVFNDRLGENCRSGCPTRDHNSWGECARAARISTQWLGGEQMSYGDVKRFHSDNASYAAAVRDGLSPEGVERHHVEKAYREADKT